MVRYGDIRNDKHATLVIFLLKRCECACALVYVCTRMRVYAIMHASIFRCLICSCSFVLANNGVVTDKDGYVPPQ